MFPLQNEFYFQNRMVLTGPPKKRIAFAVDSRCLPFPVCPPPTHHQRPRTFDCDRSHFVPLLHKCGGDDWQLPAEERHPEPDDISSLTSLRMLRSPSATCFPFFQKNASTSSAPITPIIWTYETCQIRLFSSKW